MNKAIHRLALVAFLTLVSIRTSAADKVTVTINKQTISAYRTVDLEAAKKEAAAARKPIAWIASAPKLLDGTGTISGNGSKSATLHAFYALRGSCVLIFMDAIEENHKVLKLVDGALHTPNPHYTPPTVVILDPEAKVVITTVIYEKDFARRAAAFGKALALIKEKFPPGKSPPAGSTNKPNSIEPARK